MLEDVPNSNWGTAKSFSTDELIALAVGRRARDFFAFIPPKPEDSRHPIVVQGRIQWHASPEESRYTRLADVIALNLWAQVSPGDEDTLFTDTPNAGVCLWVEVEWGSGGTNMTARVDVGRGTQLVIPADSIICRLGCIALPNAGGKSEIPWAPLPIQINAMVGRYAGAASFKPKKTEFVTDLATTDLTYVRVPNFAWGVRVAGMRSVLNAAGIEIAAVTNKTNGTEQVLDTWTALLLKDNPEYVPLPNGTEYIRVTNGTADTLALLGLEFGLAF